MEEKCKTAFSHMCKILCIAGNKKNSQRNLEKEILAL